MSRREVVQQFGWYFQIYFSYIAFFVFTFEEKKTFFSSKVNQQNMAKKKKISICSLGDLQDVRPENFCQA